MSFKSFSIIPAIDILGSKTVRLTQGDYNQVDTYAVSPVEWAKRYEAMGVKRIHLVDLDGAKDGKPVNLSVITDIRKAVSCELELGGGIRSVEIAQAWIDVGVDYLILGSLFVQEFSLACDIVSRFNHRVIAGIDAKGDFVATHGWLDTSALTIAQLLQQLRDLPLNSIIYTDIAKDGMMSGPNVDALRQFCTLTDHPVIASGGVRSVADIVTLKQYFEDGLCGCIIGKALLSGSLSLESLAPHL